MSNNEKADFRKNNCGIIFQFFELIKSQTAFDNASLPLKLQKKSKKEIEIILEPLFEVFGIKELKNQKALFLSGGEQQRVGIVRCLSSFPKYIIADEITASLDETRSKMVYEYLKSYIKKNNATGIFVSHDNLIKDYSDIDIVMESGEIKNVLNKNSME